MLNMEVSGNGPLVVDADRSLREEIARLGTQLATANTALENIRAERSELRTKLENTEQELQTALLDARLYKRHLGEATFALEQATAVLKGS